MFRTDEGPRGNLIQCSRLLFLTGLGVESGAVSEAISGKRAQFEGPPCERVLQEFLSAGTPKLCGLIVNECGRSLRRIRGGKGGRTLVNWRR